jgi:hypothetical protein
MIATFWKINCLRLLDCLYRTCVRKPCLHAQGRWTNDFVQWFFQGIIGCAACAFRGHMIAFSYIFIYIYGIPPKKVYHFSVLLLFTVFNFTCWQIFPSNFHRNLAMPDDLVEIRHKFRVPTLWGVKTEAFRSDFCIKSIHGFLGTCNVGPPLDSVNRWWP